MRNLFIAVAGLTNPEPRMLQAAGSNAAAVAQVDNFSLPALPTHASTAIQAASDRAGPAQSKALAAPDLAVLQDNIGQFIKLLGCKSPSN